MEKIKFLRKLWFKLSSKRKRQSLGLFCLMLISGIVELVAVGSFLPFLAAISDPSTAWRQEGIQHVAMYLNIKNESQLILLTAILFTIPTFLFTILDSRMKQSTIES